MIRTNLNRQSLKVDDYVPVLGDFRMVTFFDNLSGLFTKSLGYCSKVVEGI